MIKTRLHNYPRIHDHLTLLMVRAAFCMLSGEEVPINENSAIIVAMGIK